MAQRRRYGSGPAFEAIQELTIDKPDWSPAQIRRELEKRPDLEYELPSDRTIQMIVKEARPPDPSGPWSLADAEPRDVALVLPVLAAVVGKSQGRQHVTRAEAKWVVKLRSAYLDLDPWQAYRLARLYMARVERGKTTVDLDLFLAFSPWRGGEAEARYRHLWADGTIPAPPSFIVSEIVTVGVPLEERAEHELFRDNMLDSPEARKALEEQRQRVRRLGEERSPES